MHTTINLLRKYSTCPNRLQFVIDTAGPDYGDDTPITFEQILDHGTLQDALWCLRAVPSEQIKQRDYFARMLAADFAESVLHIYDNKYPNTKGLRMAIEVARKYARGLASADELREVRKAAATYAAYADATYATYAADAAYAAAAAAAAAYAADAAAYVADAEHRKQVQYFREALTKYIGDSHA